MALMDDVNKILESKGVEMAPESSVEMVSVPMRDVYLLFAFASTGCDIMKGRLSFEVAAVVLEALGATPKVMQSLHDQYFQASLDFQKRTQGKCDMDTDLADRILSASALIDRIEREKRKQI